MIAIAGIGLTTVIEAMGHWFELLRLLGAAYLIWMGWQMLRSSGRLARRRSACRARAAASSCRVFSSRSATRRR